MSEGLSGKEMIGGLGLFALVVLTGLGLAALVAPGDGRAALASVAALLLSAGLAYGLLSLTAMLFAPFIAAHLAWKIATTSRTPIVDGLSNIVAAAILVTAYTFFATLSGIAVGAFAGLAAMVVGGLAYLIAGFMLSVVITFVILRYT
ncbi:hypothetical protein [Arenimonas oryziterrae]|uniref:Uncharacterized protein n=1 Tax=Arenimonas oryziterrae DSM 21050 = YC6267 TaxID=1121015 RepID=A0A091AT78_9GAMM|nr:hypothetical protein [Arenimonas oryziterrae]KFN42546.1 hypothetical protein N789_12975 [Arenimonas oryziterrae DSM 21050 = YC6267]